MTDAPLFEPADDAKARSQLRAFTEHLSDTVGIQFDDHAALHAFSVERRDQFWRTFLSWSNLCWSGSADPVVEGADIASARFFPNVRLSYTSNLLRAGASDDIAIRSLSEDGSATNWTRDQLRVAVGRAATRLRLLGVGPGDRVAAVATNTPETIIAALAAVGIGAIWSSAAPEMADDAIIERFKQLDASVLFAHGSHRLGGVRRSLTEKVAAVTAAMPSETTVVRLGGDVLSVGQARSEDLGQWIADESTEPITEWPEFPFDQPLFILFSSGTTGPPKCIVHGAGGTLIEHVKEHRLHTDLTADDVLFFQTSTGWMMWNWLVSALASNCAIALYDGSPSIPEKDALIKGIERLQATVFGTSAAYIQYLEDAGVVPRESADLSRVRLIQSTGSILYDRQFAWLRDNVGPVPVHSISGGTDIVGCFVLGAPTLPVHAGESPCRSLGYDVRAMTSDGPKDIGRGELVCTAPFPSRPLGLYGDPDGKRFAAAYFEQHPGCWTHGDLIELTARGSARILGRCDGVMNIRGVRIGPAEIYRIVLEFEELVGAMALAQRIAPERGGDRIVLFVVLTNGAALDRPLTLRLKKAIKERTSAVHVPAIIAQVSDLPRTHSGKQSERAGSQALHGEVPDNVAALANPECLAALRDHELIRGNDRTAT